MGKDCWNGKKASKKYSVDHYRVVNFVARPKAKEVYKQPFEDCQFGLVDISYLLGIT